MADGDGITYTTKELLARIEGKIELIDAKLDSKANLSHLVDVEGRINSLRDSFQSLRNQIDYQDRINAALAQQAKEVQDRSEVKFTRKEKVIGLVLAVAAISVQVWVAAGGGM